jgi:hypothetical protein
MINRNLSLRLERLEEVITPETVRRVWQIVIVDSDGSRREGEKIEWQAPRPVPAFWETLPTRELSGGGTIRVLIVPHENRLGAFDGERGFIASNREVAFSE